MQERSQPNVGELVEIEWIDAFGWKNKPQDEMPPEINNVTRGRVLKYSPNFIYIVTEEFGCAEDHGNHYSGVAIPIANIVKVNKK